MLSVVVIDYNEPYLLVFTECCIEVYHVPTAHWIHNVPIRKVPPRVIHQLLYTCLSCRQEALIKLAVSCSYPKELFHLYICASMEQKVILCVLI